MERQTILIVESEIGAFVLELQRMLGRAGAKTLVARDVPTALLRNREFEFTAAAVNAEHEALTSAMDIPTLVYGTNETARSPEVIVDQVARLLNVKAAAPGSRPS